MANDLTDVILKTVDTELSVDTYELAAVLNEDHQKVIGAVKSLQSLGNLINGNKVFFEKISSLKNILFASLMIIKFYIA